jgi:sporulation protein YlmC with PRC-barrel domain
MSNDRHRRDAAGVGPYPRESDQLVPLSRLDKWRVSKGEPDIRGWEVRTVSGRQLGTVRDLLIDRDAGEAVMLDVNVPSAGRNANVPIRVVQIDRAARVILMDSADLGIVGEDLTPVVMADTRRDLAPPAEVVVDRRPIVEETIVRRREADIPPGADIPVDDDVLREREMERRKGERRRIDRMGTDL